MGYLNEKHSLNEFNKRSEAVDINPEKWAEDQKKMAEYYEKQKSDLTLNIKVIHNLVCVEYPGERKTESGIILNKDTDIIESAPSLVLAVGNMVKEIKKGDKVFLHGSSRPININYKNKRYLLFRESDVVAIVND
jgi:co-chaperonin GroES (HSP10)